MNRQILTQVSAPFFLWFTHDSLRMKPRSISESGEILVSDDFNCELELPSMAPINMFPESDTSQARILITAEMQALEPNGRWRL